MNLNNEPRSYAFSVSPEDEGTRIDSFLAKLISESSRTSLRQAIAAGKVTVDQRTIKGAYRLRAGQQVHVAGLVRQLGGPQPEAIDLDILFEDEHFIAVNKPPAMVVHPARGHWSGTLASALVHHCQVLSSVGGPSRPGIVHRLDRDTSGVIVAAKSDLAHLRLAEQFERRSIRKTYLALVRGVPDRDRDRIELPIGKHPYHREKMAIRGDHETSREATTDWEIAERFQRHALLRIQPRTGRTHQIRVHLASAGFPVLADRLYAGHAQITGVELGGLSPELVLERQALHAAQLELTHPATDMPMILQAPLAEDMARAIEILRGA